MKPKLVGLGALSLPAVLALTVALFGAGSGAVTPADAALAGCLPAATGSDPDPDSFPQLGAAQLGNARIIYAVAVQRGLPRRAVIVALATALQESTLRNLTSGHLDSLGLFQQRPSQGWGTPAQILDPAYAAGIFYDHLVRVPGWQTLPVTVAAQAVQGSGLPGAYAKWEPLATQLADAIGATSSSPLADGSGCSAVGCPQPVSTGSQPSTPATCADATTVLARAATWLTAWNGGPVPYLSSGDPGSWLGGYRRDCSGYASMALGLPGPGLNVRGLVARSTLLTKADLRAGDLLANPTPGAGGHVVIFDRWTDATMTKYLGYEQSGDGGTHHRAIPYPYYGTYPMTPYRLTK